MNFVKYRLRLKFIKNNLHIRCFSFTFKSFSTTYVWINADKTLLQPIENTLFGYEANDLATDEATIAGFVDSAL